MTATHTFTDALDAVLFEEGGFVHDSRDPGGMTNLGITGRTWQSWAGRPATEQIMRGLRTVDVAPIYKAWYWDKISGDALPIALALAVFDFSVNAGPPRSVEMLQGVVGAPRDGQCGKTTQAAVDIYANKIGLAKLIARFCGARRDYYRQRPEFPVFGKGWLARIDRIEREALTWTV